jgi:hypothetical protein
MSKITQTPQESGLSEQATPPLEQQGVPVPEKIPKASVKTRVPKESKVHRLSQGQELYTPKKRERKAPPLLTVEQYLRKAQLDKAISDLIRSLQKTKIMSLADWERETSALLKKKTW